ncbi:NUMOD4 domain-containing protein [Ulvibacter antarcticus]|uniref:NUMOD4 motif-containing protein n=1 Tax=Ulvibacter antarcticus TaxID=442714 RepID=A0A3L9Z367_9FLAO|nr:NUMOD4 domain-containing protein [Ulvibacter antarcticus]RMA65869.1 NUMOD4 motif-containing protein [Ulvibacter antarcticus]
MINSFRNEVWKDFTKPIWHTPKNYKISNFGRVISYDKDPDGQLKKLYLLSGYPTFSCKKKDGKTDLLYVHRVVAELFLDPDEERSYVIHKNFDKADNHVDNLKKVNKKELFAHNMDNPAVIKAKKAAKLNPKYSKLSAPKVRMIKRKIFDPNRKTRMRIIAKQFGISEMQLYRIKSGENWGHIVDY